MPGRVLIVEDNGDMRETMRLVLEAEGYDVLTAEHGAMAQLVLREASLLPGPLPGLILLDLQMPVMDGWTFLETLGEAGIPGATEIPVVIVTASRQRPPSEIETLRKPFELDQLLGVVARHFPSEPR
jgi:CheY-like chemotaxis protein